MTSSFLCSFELMAHRQPPTKIAHWDLLLGCYGKSDNSILESSDEVVHPSKESNKCSETEPTNISKVTEKYASQVS